MFVNKLTALAGQTATISLFAVFPNDKPFTVVNVEVQPTSSCKVEDTLDAPDQNGLFTNAIWTVWTAGTVSVTTRLQSNAPVTAIRLTAIGGSAEMKVVA
jgi:hypothetical protein